VSLLCGGIALKNKYKGAENLFSITKDEAFYLRKNGHSDSVKVTHSRYKKYFAIECKDVYDALKRFNKDRITTKNFG